MSARHMYAGSKMVESNTSITTYLWELPAMTSEKRKQLTPPQAAALLKEKYPNNKRKHFAASTIREAARTGKIANAEKVLERVWVVFERDLVEWASNEAVHKAGRRWPTT